MTKRWSSPQLLVAYPCLKGYWIKPQYILCKEQSKVALYSEERRKGYYCTVPPFVFSSISSGERRENVYLPLGREGNHGMSI